MMPRLQEPLRTGCAVEVARRPSLASRRSPAPGGFHGTSVRLPWHTSSREGRGGARQEMNLLLLHRRVPSGCGSPTWLALPRHYAELHRPTIGRAGGKGYESLGCVRVLDVRHVCEEASVINRPPTRQTRGGRGSLRYGRYEIMLRKSRVARWLIRIRRRRIDDPEKGMIGGLAAAEVAVAIG